MSTFSNEFTTPVRLILCNLFIYFNINIIIFFAIIVEKFFSIIRPNKRNIKLGCGGNNNQNSGATNVLDLTSNNHTNNTMNRNKTVKPSQTFVKREGHGNNLKINHQPLALPHPYPGFVNRSSNSK